MAETAYFVIADISGYTAYLTQSELDHAQSILAALLQALVDASRPPLAISNFEGDAILAYAPDSSNNVRGETMLESVEELYCAFAGTRDRMQLATNCPCAACQNIKTLDLKFILHRGSYALQKVGGREGLSGPDVILTHRLLKNAVIEKTGIAAYALVTEPAAAAIGAADFFSSLPRHAESYEHVGAVSGFVHDLNPVWRARRERETLRVGPGDALFMPAVEVELPVSPARAWDYLADPVLKARWMAGVKGITASDLKAGRTDVGSAHHCDHGKQKLALKIVDWRPLEYLTHAADLPLGIVNVFTFSVAPSADPANACGARVGLYCRLEMPGSPLKRALGAALVAIMRGSFAKVLKTSGENLKTLAAEDRARGRGAPLPKATVAATEIAAAAKLAAGVN